MNHNLRRAGRGGYVEPPQVAHNNYEEECFTSKQERDARWEELMLVKPYVVRDSTSEHGATLYRVRYPVLVVSETVN